MTAQQITDDEQHPWQPHRSAAWYTESRLIRKRRIGERHVNLVVARGATTPPRNEGHGRAFLPPRLFFFFLFYVDIRGENLEATAAVVAEGKLFPRQSFALRVRTAASATSSRHSHATHVKVQLRAANLGRCSGSHSPTAHSSGVCARRDRRVSRRFVLSSSSFFRPGCIRWSKRTRIFSQLSREKNRGNLTYLFKTWEIVPEDAFFSIIFLKFFSSSFKRVRLDRAVVLCSLIKGWSIGRFEMLYLGITGLWKYAPARWNNVQKDEREDRWLKRIEVFDIYLWQICSFYTCYSAVKPTLLTFF